MSDHRINIVTNFETKNEKAATKALDDYINKTQKAAQANDKGVISSTKAEKAVQKLSKEEDKSAKIINKYSILRDKNNKVTGVAVSQTNKLTGVTQRLQSTTSKQAQGMLVAAGYTEKHSKQLTSNIRAQEKMSHWQKLTTGQWETAYPALNKMNRALNNLRWSMVNIAFAATAIGAAMYIIYKPIQMLIGEYEKMEEAMVGVTKTAGLSQAEAESLSSQFYSMARTIPVAADELAKIAKVAGQMGIRGTEDIARFTQAISIISFVTDMTAEDVATNFAKITNAFNLPIESTFLLASSLNKLENTTAATVGNLIGGLTRVGAQAEVLGISFETSAAGIATMVDAGMSAERAGTRLRNLFLRMSSNVEEFADIAGMSVESFRNELENNADVAFQRVIDGLNRMSSSVEKSSAAFDAAGRIGGNALITLANGADDYYINLKNVNEEMRSGNSLMAEAYIAFRTNKNIAEENKSIIKDLASESAGFWGKAKKGWTDSWNLILNNNDEMKAYTNSMKHLDEALASGTIYGNQYNEILEYQSKLLKDTNNDIGLTAIYIQQLIDALSAMNEVERNELLNQTKAQDKYKNNQEALQDLKSAYEEYDSALASGNLERLIAATSELSDVQESISDQFGSVTLQAMEKYLDRLNDVTERTNNYKDTLTLLSLAMDETNFAIEGVAKVLDKYKKDLASTTDEIKRLTSMNFKMETAFSRVIQQQELVIKKQELEALGVSDAQAFIAAAVGNTGDAYSGVVTAIDNVTNAATTSQTAFEAWQTTVREHIRALIVEGNELAKNTTSAVQAHQTLLLSSSAMDTGGGQTEAETNLRRLQLAQDVYFGNMHNQVQNAIQIDEDRKNGTASSAESIISSLGGEWNQRDRLERKIKTQQQEYDDLKEILDQQRDAHEQISYAMRFEEAEVNKLIPQIDTLSTKYANLASNALSYSNAIGRSSSGASGSSFDRSQYNASTTTQTGLGGKEYKITRYTPKDFLLTNDGKYIEFAQNDTIMGFNGEGPLGNGGGQSISIGNITINGANGNPSSFANEFVMEIKRQLRTQ